MITGAEVGAQGPRPSRLADKYGWLLGTTVDYQFPSERYLNDHNVLGHNADVPDVVLLRNVSVDHSSHHCRTSLPVSSEIGVVKISDKSLRVRFIPIALAAADVHLSTTQSWYTDPTAT